MTSHTGLISKDYCTCTRTFSVGIIIWMFPPSIPTTVLMIFTYLLVQINMHRKAILWIICRSQNYETKYALIIELKSYKGQYRSWKSFFPTVPVVGSYWWLYEPVTIYSSLLWVWSTLECTCSPTGYLLLVHRLPNAGCVGLWILKGRWL